MSVTHPAAVRNAVTDFIVDQLDSGGPGKLKFRIAGTADSPGTAVATLTLSATAFGNSGAVTPGMATAATITQDGSATGHASPVATATLETAAGSVKVHCAVAASGSDVNMSNGLTINSGDIVNCTSLTYTAMP